MLRRFYLDEPAYAAWMREHPDGFVFNHFGGSDAAMNVVHLADCRTLRRSADTGARTRVAKICGLRREEVEAEATRLRGGADGWRWCGTCRRTR